MASTPRARRFKELGVTSDELAAVPPIEPHS
jgi:hypothetical protein